MALTLRQDLSRLPLRCAAVSVVHAVGHTLHGHTEGYIMFLLALNDWDRKDRTVDD